LALTVFVRDIVAFKQGEESIAVLQISPQT
jgi:hypothetical protein